MGSEEKSGENEHLSGMQDAEGRRERKRESIPRWEGREPLREEMIEWKEE